MHPFTHLFLGMAELVVLLAGTLLYFAPSILAFLRNKQNKIAILALNFFAGWTFIGWVVALVWALTKDPPSPTISGGSAV